MKSCFNDPLKHVSTGLPANQISSILSYHIDSSLECIISLPEIIKYLPLLEFWNLHNRSIKIQFKVNQKQSVSSFEIKKVLIVCVVPAHCLQIRKEKHSSDISLHFTGR